MTVRCKRGIDRSVMIAAMKSQGANDAGTVGMYVCYHCWGHVHCCEPSHTKAECEDWKYIKQLEAEGGKAAVKQYLDRIRLEEIMAQ